ncbi:hypothetical protein ABT117_24840 [Streptomyces sp. NPDC002262]|uniref:hypothetical protein n=1 Tax=Streptomyces sp. NPDC002262 TaxID=3154414 RepID=UPI003319FEF1
MVLRNTVTDADGDTANLTFQVYTTNADGTPKAQVDLDGSGQYGVLVSPYVASGSTAKVTVPYGKLKPGVLYKFRTSAFDGSLYETNWSAWADFRIDPYMKFPAPQTASTIDPLAQTEIEVTRTDPGAVALAGLRASGERSCSTVDAKGRKLCIEITPPSKQSKEPAASSRAGLAEPVDLVAWCGSKPLGKDYMSRSEACLKDIGTATLIFLDADPQLPALGLATFDLQQRIKTYPNKGASGSDFAEFDQQLVAMPRSIDAALQGVNLTWLPSNSCASCSTTQTRWTDINGAVATGHWGFTEAGPLNARYGTVQTIWSGTGKETIDLGWAIRATVDVSLTSSATADFGTSGDARVRELAPRCDNLVKGSAPGCVLPYFNPNWTVDTNLYPAAGAYYWYMQQVMPDHAGSKRWDSLMHYLGPDTTVKNSAGGTWTSDNSRTRVCDSTWSIHPSDASVGSVDCDEFAMASTHESGGFPNSVNLVTSGSKCAQLYTDKMGDGSANFGILADTRTATNGPSGTERCGRAAIPSVQNQQAFNGFPAPSWRMLDGDGFFLNLPGYEHCTSAATTCTWRKIG